MTALDVFGINTASTTLATAMQLVSTNGGATVGGTGTKVGQATGFGELLSQGTTNNWPSLGSIGNPSGDGWLFDNALLEGQTIAAGVWTLAHHLLNNGTNSYTADIIVRVWKRSSGGIFTAIGSVTLASQTIPTSSTLFTLTTASLPAMAFGTGDKLYMDIWLNVASGGSGASIKVNTARGSGATGASGFAEIDTPGFSPTPAGTHVIIADGLGGLFV